MCFIEPQPGRGGVVVDEFQRPVCQLSTPHAHLIAPVIPRHRKPIVPFQPRSARTNRNVFATEFSISHAEYISLN
jgi:hypothetical protein